MSESSSLRVLAIRSQHVGILLLFAGLTWLAFVTFGWPAIPVGVGLFLVVRGVLTEAECDITEAEGRDE